MNELGQIMSKAADSLPVWDMLSKEIGTDGLLALSNFWYNGIQVGKEDYNFLTKVYQKYPLGAPTFNIWFKQRLRQVQANAASTLLREQGEHNG